ncbi:hypothetical protein G9C98_001595 [Cotesia typhae]|uniref:Odorant receptor n=1 Tax=Cotesia typhae TaxID=2053667 RepID=A0A8J5QLV0_9HYME|nr:hypothetical protein G9C98_001595 [Cotesia typhae]
MRKSPIITHRSTLNCSLRLANFFGLYDVDDKSLVKYIVFSIFRTFNWIVVSQMVAANIADFCINIDDILEVSYNLGFILALITTNFKAAAIYYQQNKFRQLIDEVHRPISLLKYSSDLGVLTIIRTGLVFQRCDYGAYIFSAASTVGTNILPMKLVLKTRQLPVRGEYPFNGTVSPNFEIIYGAQSYALLVACLWVLVFDTTLLGFIRWINVQLIILQANFRHCDDIVTGRASFSMSDRNYEIIKSFSFFGVPEEQEEIRSFIPFTEEEANVEDDSFVIRFRSCVMHHRRLISHLNEFNDLFNVILFGQILTSCTLTCVGMFQLVLNDKLSVSIYQSGWENYISKETKGLILNGLIQGLMPMKMKAGAFFIFSMKTYLTVIRTSYSYFAILSTTTSSDD